MFLFLPFPPLTSSKQLKYRVNFLKLRKRLPQENSKLKKKKKIGIKGKKFLVTFWCSSNANLMVGS